MAEQTDKERSGAGVSLTSDPLLCYVDGHWAYFTTQDLAKQWGDDWDDAPYEHNAGLPYGPHREDEHWEIVRLVWDGPFVTPNDGTINSMYSVRDINSGAVAWLYDKYGSSRIAIRAGTPLTEFKALVKKAGGQIFTEEK